MSGLNGILRKVRDDISLKGEYGIVSLVLLKVIYSGWSDVGIIFKEADWGLTFTK